MKIMQIALTALIAGLFVTPASAADNKKLLVGKWEVVKADEGTLPVGTIVDYSAEGKSTITAKKGGKESTVEGSYTIDGDSFTYKLNFGGKDFSNKITIKKISETEMDTANPEGKAVAFKRVK
jgi:uncharacterized protein (TIGR03066 family)